MKNDAPGGPELRWRAWALPLAVAALAFLAFLPALRAGFVKLDDDFNYLNNDKYRGLGLEQLRWMFFTFQLGGVYQPLSWLTNAADYRLWGMNPMGYHLGNLLIHAAGAALFYLLAVRFLRTLLPPKEGDGGLPLRLCAAFSALAFAVHPQRVEAVAWASNRSYVLPALFYIAALWSYLEANAPEGCARPGRWRALAAAAFALSLMSKAIAVTLPAVLVILDVYPLRRLGGEKGWLGPRTWAAWLEKVPFGLLALAGVVIGANGRAAFGAFVPVARFGWSSRVAEAMFGAVFYLEKLLVPLHLAPMITLPAHLGPFDELCLLRTLVFAGLCLAAVLCWRRRPAVTALWAAHLVTLSPFLGLSQYGLMLQIAADKWFHIAAVGWSLAAGGVLYRWRRAYEEGRLSGEAFRRLACAAASAVAVWAALTWSLSATWKDTRTLFNHNLAVDPGCYFCHNNLAVQCNEEKRHDEAIAHAKESIRIRPDYTFAHINLGVGLVAEGRLDEAVEDGQAAIELDPRSAQARFNQGWYLSLKGRMDEAIFQTQEALRLDSGMVSGHYNLGFFYQTKNRLPEAEAQYREAIRLDPKAANARYNLGIILTSQGRAAEAVEQCAEAHRLNPGHDSPLCRRTP